MNPYIIPGVKLAKPLTDDELFKKVLEVVEEVCGFSYEGLKKKNKSRDRVLARNLVYYVLRSSSKTITLKLIGVWFGKDHTTIIHGVQTVQDLLDSKDELALKWYQLIKRKIQL